jgi:acyl-coenzyme A thioesterase PaaI-like protein
MDIYKVWQRFAKIPGGRYLFNRFLARQVPYTGSIRPEVLELAPGYARVRMRDRRAVRNHLESVHAAALMNILEATSGLAFVSGLPPNARAILTGFEIRYLKKARGELTASCRCDPPRETEAREYLVEAALENAAGERVAEATARWRVGIAK